MKFLSVTAFLLFFPLFAKSNVVINEIAWMGTIPYSGETVQAAANNEWMELYNPDEISVSLEGWRIVAERRMPDILLSGAIAGKSYFLLERGNDAVIPNVPADIIYPYKGNALSNSGGLLFLKNASGDVVDEINAVSGWSAGDNGTKETMQKVAGGWITAPGTPRSENAKYASSRTSNPSPASSKILPPFKIFTGENKRIFAGSFIKFKGSSTKAGGGYPQDIHISWNFGNGETREGEEVSYSFKIQGIYIVSMQVSEGGETRSDSMTVTVLSNQIRVGSVIYGRDGFIRLVNPMSFASDVSGWTIADGKNTFIVPQGTFIAPRGESAFQNLRTGLLLTGDTPLVFRYPDSRVAFEWKREKTGAAAPVTYGNQLKDSEQKTMATSAEADANHLMAKARKNETYTTDSAGKHAYEHASDISSFSPGSKFFFWGALIVSAFAALGFLAVRIFFS